MDLGGSEKNLGSPWVSPFLIVSQWLFLDPIPPFRGTISTTIDLSPILMRLPKVMFPKTFPNFEDMAY